MGKIVSVSNHKGGVGKTTSTVNLGAGLAGLGNKVLLIDLDPQANLSQSLAVEKEEKNIYGALVGDYGLEPYEIYEGLEVVPSHLDLSGAEVELSSEAGREYILREILEPFKEKYDYILIDCPPSLGLLTINAFTASDQILIPLQAEYLALQGLSKLTEVIGKIKKRLNKDLELRGVFVTQYDKRKVLNRDVMEAVQSYFGEKVMRARIRNNVALAEAPTQGLDIFRYNEKSNGAMDYLSLAREMDNLNNNILLNKLSNTGNDE